MSTAVTKSADATKFRQPDKISGMSFAITGKMSRFSRADAEALIVRNGGSFRKSVVRELDYLVIGEKGYLAEIATSNKLARAEVLQGSGYDIQIIDESAFLELLGYEDNAALEERYYSLARIERVFPEIERSLVQRLVRHQVLTPVLQTHGELYFQFSDLRLFRRTRELMQAGLQAGRIHTRLKNEQRMAAQYNLPFEVSSTVSLRRHKPQASKRSAKDWYFEGYTLDNKPEKREQAIHAYKQALETDPAYVPAMINLARLYHQDDALDAASEWLEKARKYQPENPTILFNLALLHEARNDLLAAKAAYLRALRYRSDYEACLFNLALLEEQLDTDAAKPYWQKYLDLDQESERARIARGYLLR